MKAAVLKHTRIDCRKVFSHSFGNDKNRLDRCRNLSSMFLDGRHAKLGKYASIVLIIDNGPWYNRLTDDTIPPRRPWRKQFIVQWVNDHNICS
jgi:hypothetical protein